LTPLNLAQSLEIEFAAKLDGTTGLRIAAGIGRLIDGMIDPKTGEPAPKLPLGFAKLGSCTRSRASTRLVRRAVLKGFDPIGRMVAIVMAVLRAERDHFMHVPEGAEDRRSNLRGMSADTHHP
jgi:hypothetical protein